MAIFQWPRSGGGARVPLMWRLGATHTARWTGAPLAPHLGANASFQLFFFLLIRVYLKDLGILSHLYMHFMM